MSFIRRAARSGRYALAVALILTASACNKPPAAQQMPPPAVQVVHPIEREVTEYLFYNGTTRGQKQTQVRARVPGYLEKVHFLPDRYVKEGEVLFTIDQRQYRVAVERAEADVAGKKAEVTRAKSEFDRLQTLVTQNAASEQELINRRADYDSAVAALQSADAALSTAKLNIEFTEVKAPFGGRVSRNLVDKGTLVKADDDTVLCTIVDDDVIYVYFNPSEREFLDYLKAHPNSRKTKENQDVEPTLIDVGTQNDVGFPRPGVVTAVNNTVDVGTATIEVRGELQNTDKQLAPGLTVRVRATMGYAKSILIPDVAVQADPRGQFVYVVNDKNIVERRSVQAGQQVGPFRRILDGVKVEDRVISNGLMMVRIDAPVNPTLVEPPPLPTTVPSSTQPTTQPSHSAS